MDLPQRFPYRGRWPNVLWPSVFFGFGTAVIVNEAIHRVGWGAVLLWLVAFFSMLYTLMALLPVFRWMALSCPILELGNDGVILPHGFLHRKTKAIVYGDIRAVREERSRGQRVLILHTSTDFGRITASLLPDDDAYATVKKLLFKKANSLEK